MHGHLMLYWCSYYVLFGIHCTFKQSNTIECYLSVSVCGCTFMYWNLPLLICNKLYRFFTVFFLPLPPHRFRNRRKLLKYVYAYWLRVLSAIILIPATARSLRDKMNRDNCGWLHECNVRKNR